MANKKILLIEPGYKNKYPPLGLMKIAQYHGADGRQDSVKFIKGEDKSVIGQVWDRVYVTSLFSFEWNRIAQSIDFALEAVNGQADKVFVGGIAASLMNDQFIAQPQWRGVRFIKGLLDQAPAKSLQLDDFEGELYSDDISGEAIEDLTPDYSILDQIEYEYPVHDAYFVYASRGCVRKCKFCGVPSLEGEQRDTYSVTKIVNDIEKRYGAKKDLVFMDNNVVASPRFKEIIAEIRDLGFTPGATLRRGRGTLQRRVDFNQGVDARILCKDKMYLEELSTIAIKPLRIAFDHLGVRKPYEQAIRFAADAGLVHLSNYMLYNFHDTPKDLFERMRLNVQLNEELGIRIFSFPMRYQPIDLPDRSHIGPNWNSYILRSMQVILQATHGIVSGAPDYFKTAFGNTYEDFESILMRPHHFIFNRYWYEQYDGKSELAEYESKFSELTDNEHSELIEFLSSRHINKFRETVASIKSKTVREVAEFYVPLSKSDERKIWDSQKERRLADKAAYLVPTDELVEDAGLNETELPFGQGHNSNQVELVA
jgi:hypothetical protein